MPAKKKSAAASYDGGIVLTADEYAKLTNLLDELAFRGKSQEALVMRIANCGGFDDVITRIKRRRLYTKKMAAGVPAGDDSNGTSTPRPRRKKGSKPRRRPTRLSGGGSPSPEAAAGE